MNFEEAVKYLYSLGNEVLAMKLGLENPRRLFKALGNPQQNFLKIQVAGTNGKGSVCAFLDSICRQAGIKTGLYTSPHLISVTERIKIDGESISEEDFARYATIVRNIIEESGSENKEISTPNQVTGTSNSIDGTSDKEIGTSDKETGNENLVRGTFGKESGTSNKESRTSYKEKGTANLIAGTSNSIKGSENLIEGTANLITGSENQIIPTFFEQMTAIALIAFAENKVDLAILETGLGGRLDATTAANAEIVAITPIDYDHQQYLGETLKEIAGEKAAIIRQDTKVIVAPQPKDAEQVIKGKCRELGVEPLWATTNIKSKVYDEADYLIVSTNFKTEKNNYPGVVLGLTGKHQAANAAVAIGIVETLRELDFKITDDAVWIGLETAQHKGRLEYYKSILFDGAHNIAGAKALRDYLQEFIKQPITLIFGAMKDKQIKEIAEILFPLADKLILTKPDNPRSALPEELAELTTQNVHLTESVAEALALAKEFPDNLTCVTGSLYLVGEAQKILADKSK